jgi:hypothetical protein
MHRFRLAFQEVMEIHREDVHGPDAGARSDDGGERLEVRVVLVRRQEDELLDTGLLPCVDQVVETPVQCLAPQ